PEALVLLKAKAWLDLTARREGGAKVHENDIRKHRNDAFRLSVLLAPAEGMELPAPVLQDLRSFLEALPALSKDWQAIRAAAGFGERMPAPAELLQVLRGFSRPPA
nr:hypothetical protein [Planctomycetota bacterium]